MTGRAASDREWGSGRLCALGVGGLVGGASVGAGEAAAGSLRREELPPPLLASGAAGAYAAAGPGLLCGW